MSYKKLIKGLQILAKYDPDGLRSTSICAEHNTVYAGHGTKLSVEDRKYMKRLGWFRSDVDSWAFYT